jgi:hypothetical protein
MGAGEAARTAVSRGWRGIANCPPPPRPHRGAAILAEGARELHRKRRTMIKRQSKVDERCLLTRGSKFRAPTPPPPQKKKQNAIGLGGQGWQDSIWRRKKRAWDVIIMRWTMTTTTMARVGSKGKSINNSL